MAKLNKTPTKRITNKELDEAITKTPQRLPRPQSGPVTNKHNDQKPTLILYKDYLEDTENEQNALTKCLLTLASKQYWLRYSREGELYHCKRHKSVKLFDDVFEWGWRAVSERQFSLYCTYLITHLNSDHDCAANFSV